MSRPPEILRAASPLSAKPNRNNRAGSVLYISADDGAYTFAYLPAFNGAAADNQHQSYSTSEKGERGNKPYPPEFWFSL